MIFVIKCETRCGNKSAIFALATGITGDIMKV